MLRNIGNMSPEMLIIQVLAISFVVFITLPVHEFAHAWAAYKLGDDTAKLQGRLTLNPLAHLSPWGTLLIFLFGFGYAKPVPVNVMRFKNRKRDMAITAFAGPASNLIMAFILLFIYNIIRVSARGDWGYLAAQFIYFAAAININLAVFNLLPIPPLDGSRIIGLVVPDKYYYQIMQYERIIMIVVMVLLFTGFLMTPLMTLSSAVMKFFNFVVSLPFNFLF